MTASDLNLIGAQDPFKGTIHQGRQDILRSRARYGLASARARTLLPEPEYKDTFARNLLPAPSSDIGNVTSGEANVREFSVSQGS